MNKLRHNNKINNNIKFYPIGFELNYETAKEEIEWAERTWNHLLNDSLDRHSFYSKNTPDTKYIITVYSDSEFVYLIQCIRTKWNTDSTMVYMQPLTDDNVSDFKAIAKFMHLNNNTLTKNYKQLLLDAKASVIKAAANNTDGVA
jgi:hypothetical protein